MATPIGHALAGWAVYSGWVGPIQRERRPLLAVAAFAAVAADLDFVPGVLLGQPALYHHGITHSLGVGLAFSLVLAGLVARKYGDFLLLFRIGFLAYSSHLLIDYFGPDGRPPIGIPLFWPLSSEYVISPYTLFLGMRHADKTSDSLPVWLSGVFQLYNLVAISLELVLIGPVVWFCRRYRRIRQGRKRSESGGGRA